MKWFCCAALVVLGCRSSETSKRAAEPAPPNIPASDAAAAAAAKKTPVATGPSAWLPGYWTTAKADVSERWVHIDGVLVGLGMSHEGGKTRFFEVMLLRGGPKGLTYTAMPSGRRAVDFTGNDAAGRRLVLRNPKNSHPSSLQYWRDGATLKVETAGSKGKQLVTYSLGEQKPAPALESADRTFAKDSGARGGSAWADRFETRGAMWPLGSRRIEGAAAIAKAINAGRADGAVLRWSPAASGMSVAGDVGFTAGTYRLETAKGKTARKGVYVSVWRRNADGAWKIAFDTGVQTSAGAKAAP